MLICILGGYYVHFFEVNTVLINLTVFSLWFKCLILFPVILVNTSLPPAILCMVTGSRNVQVDLTLPYG